MFFARFGRSKIEGVMDKEGVTLEDLLNEEELLQECYANNNRIVTFVTRPENLVKLVDYALNPPPQTDDVTVQYKFPSVAAKVLACETAQIVTSIVTSEEIMNKFFEYLRREPPLNPLQSGFFAHIMSVLLNHKTADLLKAVLEQPDFADTLLSHIETSAIMELTIAFVRKGEASPDLKIREWLDEVEFISGLFERLGPAYNADVNMNAVHVINDILTECVNEIEIKTPSPLLAAIVSKDTVDGVLSLLGPESQGHPSFDAALSALMALVELYSTVFDSMPQIRTLFLGEAGGAGTTTTATATAGADGGSGGGEAGAAAGGGAGAGGVATGGAGALTTMTTADGQSLMLPPLFVGVSDLIPQLTAMLATPPPTGPLNMSYKSIPHPLGHCRLKIIELLIHLMRSSFTDFHRTIIDLGLLRTCMDLFVQYHWNNALHFYVAELLITVLHSESNELLRPALVGVREALLRCVQANAESEIRLGFMGHVTIIANAINKREVDDPTLLESVEEPVASQWTTFVNSELALINRVNDTPLGEEVGFNHAGEAFLGDGDAFFDASHGGANLGGGVEGGDGLDFGGEFGDGSGVEFEANFGSEEGTWPGGETSGDVTAGSAWQGFDEAIANRTSEAWNGAVADLSSGAATPATGTDDGTAAAGDSTADSSSAVPATATAGGPAGQAAPGGEGTTALGSDANADGVTASPTEPSA